jgi:hypothetical protein
VGYPPQTGDLVWAVVSTPMESWCRQNGYVDAMRILGQLSLNTPEVPLRNCTVCDSYGGCTDESGEPDPTYCSAVDGDAIASSILAALAKLDEVGKNEVLGHPNSDEW